MVDVSLNGLPLPETLEPKGMIAQGTLREPCANPARTLREPLINTSFSNTKDCAV